MTILIRERIGERILPWCDGDAHPDSKMPEGTAVTRMKELVKALFLPMSIVVVVSVFVSAIPDGIADLWAPEFGIKELGYSDTDYAHWVSIALLVSATLGLVFGPIIDRFGVLKIFRLALLVSVFVYAGYYFLAATLVAPVSAIVSLLVLKIAKIMVFITGIAIFMFLCRKSISATQFACYMALLNLGRSFGSYLYPSLSEWAGLDGMFLVVSGLFALAWVVSLFFNLDTHRRHLGKNY